MMAGYGLRLPFALLAMCTLLAAVPADGAVKPRTIIILPFDASGLDREEQWVGEGASQILALALAQHPAFVQIERARVRTAAGRPELWGETVVLQAARTLKADAALYGRITRQDAELHVQPRVAELKGGDPVALEPIVIPEGELLTKLASLPVVYARTLKVALSDAELRRMERAAAPTRSLKAFELFSRAAEAGDVQGKFSLAWAYDQGKLTRADTNRAGQLFLEVLRSGENVGFYAKVISDFHTGLTGATMKVIQEGLRADGRYQGSVDGAFGPSTERALKSFGG